MMADEPDKPQVTISRKLNLVLTVETDKGRAYIHSTPISRAVFDENFLVISRAFTEIYTHGLGPVTGPRVAKLLLKQCAEQMGIWPQVEQNLMGEIIRLTNVFAPGPDGWDTLPYNVARQRAIIDDDAAAEAENAIVYFTCASSIHMRAETLMALDGLKTLWGAQITSLPPTEFKRSLPTLTPVATTGEKPPTVVPPQSSIPV